LLQLRKAALEQYAIISSRMVAGDFMELLYYLAEGKRFKDRSQFRAFRRWMLDTAGTNPYVYFAHAVRAARDFDREHRSPEVHSGSRYPMSFLVPLRNGAVFDLMNVMMNVFGPLFAILDGHAPQPPQWPLVGTSEWMEAYRTKDAAGLRRMLDELLPLELPKGRA
jgi:hypothetical protein